MVFPMYLTLLLLTNLSYVIFIHFFETGGRLRMDPNDDRLLPLDDHNPNCNEQNVDNSKNTKTRKGRCLR